MSECTHDCSSCGANCPSRDQQQSLLEKPHAGTNIKKVIAVMSGKGGDLVLATCQKVLRDEYPDVYDKILPALPDEKFRRLGQSATAAGLPAI